MNNIIEKNGFSFLIEFNHDDDSTPYDDGLAGELTGWTREKKEKPYQLLISDRYNYRYYLGNDKNEFNLLYSWFHNQWSYLIVTVTLLDTQKNKTDIVECVSGVDNNNNYHENVAGELVDCILNGYGKYWGEKTVISYGAIK